MSRKTRIIAEIGENHLGRMDFAEGLIELAARAGSDIVKFQSYWGQDTAEDDPEREAFGDVELSDEQHCRLMKTAGDHHVEFLSSPFTVERARFLAETLGLSAIKVASGKMRNAPLLEYLNAQGDSVKVVYLSTGTARIDEIRQAVDRLDRIEQVVVMHCVSEYPCPDAHANLRAIQTLHKTFPGHTIGYSDHTKGIEACVTAVALGARVLEKHFTFSTDIPGDDHPGGMTPAMLGEMVARIERLEAMLGDGLKQPTELETEILPMFVDRFGD